MSTFIVPENVAISDTGFIFLPSTGESFTLNAIGRDIYKMLQQNLPYSEIMKNITSNYDVEESVFEKDFFDFVNQLTNFNLLRTI